jgi:hypothetical protein
MLENGSIFPTRVLDEPTTKHDLAEALKYGIHKSAKIHADILHHHLSKELSKGWIIPILPEHANQLKQAA